MKETISKFDWLTAQECPAKAWYGLRISSKDPNEAAQFRMMQGQEVGEWARRLYPEGILVAGTKEKGADEITQELIANRKSATLFEATFCSGSFVAKADILRCHSDSWHVLEVKSSFSDTVRLDGTIDDLAYTVMVLKRAGLEVVKASLLLISRAYRFGGSADRLFVELDKTTDVLARVEKFEGSANCQLDILFNNTPPIPVLCPACRECDYFKEPCLGAGFAHTVLEIPGLHPKKLQQLSGAGTVDLSLVPPDLKLNDRQERAKNAAICERVFVDPALEGALNAVSWPCHYLDFETVATVLPLFPGHGCHQQVLTQFSVHHRETMTSETQHSEYLADEGRDCQRELAEALIAATARQGSIIVYSSFEQVRIKALQQMFPDLNGQLQSILNRLIDLLPFITDFIYHPNFQGSFSIKKVLPALVPDLSYRDLAIRDGDTAITRFALMARGEIKGSDVATTRTQLLDYCRIDTLAMVRLHEKLAEMATRTRAASA